MKRGMTNQLAGLLLAALAVTGCVLVREAQATAPPVRRRITPRRPGQRPQPARQPLPAARPGVSAAAAPVVSANFRISSGSSVSVNGGVEFGLYSGLGFSGGRIYPAWADNSTTLPANPDLPGSRTLDIAVAPITVAGGSPTVQSVSNASALTDDQYQPAVAVNPTNPLNAVVVADDYVDGLTASYTTDGGTTWNTQAIARAGSSTPSTGGTPAVAFDSFGNCYLTYLTGTFYQCALAISTDGGAHFQNVTTFGNDVLAANVATGPGPTGGQSIWIAYFDYGTQAGTALGVHVNAAPVSALGNIGSFSHWQLSDLGSSDDPYVPDIAIGPAGQAVVAYQDQTEALEGPSPITVRVNAGGLTGTFNTATQAGTTNVGWVDTIPPQSSYGIDASVGLAWDRSGGANQGRLYLAYTDETPNNTDRTDIMLRYSDNNGATWSTAVKVNDDAGTRCQFFPRIAVDQTTGNVAITWYDCRNDGGTGSATDSDNTANTDAEYWGALITPSVSRAIQVGASTYNVAEGAGNASISVIRTGDTSSPATVQYATANNTATAGSDYTVTSGTLSFNAGEAVKTIPVPILTDTLLEPSETFTVTLSNPTGDPLGSPVSATVTVADDLNATAPSAVTATAISANTIRVAWTDNSTNEDNFILERKTDSGSFAVVANPTTSPYNDTTVTVGPVYTYRLRARKSALQSANSPEASASIATYQLSATTYSGLESAGSVSITVNRTASTSASTVDLQLAGVSATPGTDFTQPATVSFGPNDTSKTVAVTLADDDQIEPSETFAATLANPSAGTFVATPASATVTIQDDTSRTAPSGLTATVISPGRIRLDWVDNAGNETQFAIERQVGSGAFAAYTTASANVTTYTDTAVTPGVSYGYRLKAVSGAQSSASSNAATATVTLVQFSAATAGVLEGGSVQLTVTRSGDTTIPVTVAYASVDGTATSPADYGALTGTLTFNAGETSKTLTLNAATDLAVEGNEQLRVDLGTVTGVGAVLGANASITVTVTDDPLVIPATLAATVVNATTVRLDWTTTAVVPTQFLVERRTGAAGQFATLTTTAVGALTYTDTTVTTETDYTYRVRAVSGANQSNPSPEATVRIAAGAKASVTPTKINFGTAKLPAAAKQKTVKIKNAGKVELRGTVGTPTGTFEIVSGGGSFTLAPKQTRTVVLKMTLATPGTAAGTLLVTTTDPKKAAVTVKLSGKAK